MHVFHQLSVQTNQTGKAGCFKSWQLVSRLFCTSDQSNENNINKHFSVVFGAMVRLKRYQETASYSWWPRSNLDQRDWWRLIPGCWVLLSYCGPGWRRETESRERWRLSARLWPTALSSCPTGKHGRTTWRQNREETQCRLLCERIKQSIALLKPSSRATDKKKKKSLKLTYFIAHSVAVTSYHCVVCKVKCSHNTGGQLKIHLYQS